MKRARYWFSIIFPLGLMLGSIGCSADRGRPSGAKDLNEFEKQLMDFSARESKKLSGENRNGTIPSRPVAIVGDGIAGAAAALNLGTGVRVYGSPSFWADLQGLPEVWQTNLAAPFKNALLTDPRDFDKVSPDDRIARKAVLAVDLQGLIQAHADYLRTGPVFAVPESDGTWKLVDTEGHSEIATDALIVATGLLRARRITDAIPSREAGDVRRALVLDGKVMTGDEYLANLKPPGSNQDIGILGAGGNSADCVLHAILDARVNKVIVWGKVPDVLTKTKAYQDMVSAQGDQICRVDHNFSNIGYTSGDITIDKNTDTQCILEKSKKREAIPPIRMLIESLGRYEGDPPPLVATAARNRSITYHPVIAGGQLIAVRVSFGDGGDNGVKTSKPIYLIGAAATWIPPGVTVSKSDLAEYNQAMAETEKALNSASGTENGRQGFAAAAFMGAHLAKECFHEGHLTNSSCQ